MLLDRTRKDRKTIDSDAQFNVEARNGKNHGGPQTPRSGITRKRKEEYNQKLKGNNLEILLRPQTATELVSLSLLRSLLHSYKGNDLLSKFYNNSHSYCYDCPKYLYTSTQISVICKCS